MSDDPRREVAVAILTHNRPDDLTTLLDALTKQTAPVRTVVIVDNGAETADLDRFSEAFDLRYVKSQVNLGGAGGFSLAMLIALATAPDWVWIMDDDACPEDADTLSTLLEEAEQRGLSAVSPIIAAPEDPSLLSFPFRVDGKLSYDRAAVSRTAFWRSEALLFNGLLIRREAVFEIGLPDLRMFIRGDEVDYLLRLRKSGLPFGTVTSAAFRHPTGWGEVNYIVKGRYHILVPETAFKRFYFFRNRGYLIRRHARPVSLVVDLIGYSTHFAKKRDLRGFREWFRSFRTGLRADFGGSAKPDPREDR